MRYLILSDTHSNLEALESCLEMAHDNKFDQAVCLGDLVGYGPDPNPVVSRVREVARVIIRGNHDKARAGITDAEDFNPLARAATMWTRAQLTPANLDFLRSLPAGPLFVDWFQIAHGSPNDEDEYVFNPIEALPRLRNLPAQVVFFGHTHFQGGFMLTPKGKFHYITEFSSQKGRNLALPVEDGGRYLLNPGAVGQPRDGDWHAAFAILDEKTRVVEYYRTPYDLARTQQKMRAAGLPQPLIKRLEIGR